MSPETVLIADDDPSVRTILTEAVKRAGYKTQATDNADTLLEWISKGLGDVVISDVIMPEKTAFDILPIVTEVRPELRVILVSAQNTFLTAVKATEYGAFDYLPKPFDLDVLLSTVRRALDEPSRDSTIHTEETDEALPLIGRSLAMQGIYRTITRVMQTDLTVLITGGSGTGKELVARALHDFGARKDNPFIAVNMAAIPRELIESELFGHEKGAFTGATHSKSGQFELASGGTLFLDEIGDMPMDAQTRLLRVLQEGEVTPVGGRKRMSVDVRIIAATNKDLSKQMHKGTFREDLFYRLNVIPVAMPALKERAEDIPDLVDHFLQQSIQAGLPQKSFTTNALDCLKRHSWPGNVRELENLVRRLCALSIEGEIDAAAIENELDLDAGGKSEKKSPKDLSIEEFLSQHMSEQLANFHRSPPAPGLYDRLLAEFERPVLSSLLRATNGNQIKTAEILGINRNTLRKKLREYGINIKTVRNSH